MLARYRCLLVVASLAAAVTLPARAQRGASAMRRLPYGYFRYRISRPTREFGFGFGAREELRLRALDRVRDRQLELQDRMRDRRLELQNRLRDRQFELQNRLHDQRFQLEDRAWRRQLENQDRARDRMYERFDRLPRFRPYTFRWRSRTI